MKNLCLILIIISFFLVEAADVSRVHGAESESAGSAEEHYKLGVEHMDRGWYKDAVQEFKEALRLNPESADAHFNLGIVYRARELYEEAIMALTEALRLKPGNATAHFNLGKVYKALVRYPEAIAELEAALKIDPEFPKAYASLDIARKKEVLLKNPEDVKGYLALGDVLVEQRRNKESVVAFRAALKYDPLSIEGHSSLGKAYRRLRMYRESIMEFRKVLMLDEDNAKAHTLLGKAYRALGKHEDSLMEFHRAIEIDPSAEALYTLGFAYIELRMFKEARPVLEESIKADPEHATAHFHLGTVYQELGMMRESVREKEIAMVIMDKKIGAAPASR